MISANRHKPSDWFNLQFNVLRFIPAHYQKSALLLACAKQQLAITTQLLLEQTCKIYVKQCLVIQAEHKDDLKLPSC